MNRDALLLGGYRADGRRANQGRQCTCQLGRLHCHYGRYDASDAGAAIFQLGQTRILAQVVDDLTQRKTNQIISANVVWSPAALAERRMKRSGSDKTTALIQHAIEQAFTPLCLGSNMSNSRIVLSLTVLSADGGFLAASLNAASLALNRAGISMTDCIHAACIGWWNNQTITDPSSNELSQCEAEITVAFTGRDHTISVLLCENQISMDSLERMIEAADKFITTVVKPAQDEAVQRHIQALATVNKHIYPRLMMAPQCVESA